MHAIKECLSIYALYSAALLTIFMVIELGPYARRAGFYFGYALGVTLATAGYWREHWPNVRRGWRR